MTSRAAQSLNHPGKPPALWSIIAVSALLASWGEIVLRLVASRVRPEPVFVDPAAVWVAPIAATVLFAAPISLAWLLGRRKADPGAAWRWALAVALALATFDVLQLIPRVHPAAFLLVAAGIGVQLTRLAARSTSRTRSTLLVVVGILGLASVGGGVAVTVASKIHDRSVFSAASTTGAGAPNVLLLVLDTVRADELSAYGYGRPTSANLAAFAADGVRFDWAVATAPWTLPSHATLFTGLYPRELSTGWNTPLGTEPLTLAERFAKLGYTTGGFVANFRYTTREYGLSRGFEIYRDYAVTPSSVVGSTMIGRRVVSLWNALTHQYVLPGRKSGVRVVNEFLEFEASRGKRPYFAFLNLFDPHEPYAPDSPYDTLFLAREPRTRAIEVGTRLDTAAIRELRDAYDGSLASTDAAVGYLIDKLRQRGTLENTIVVVTSDHGEEFGDHGHLSHGNGLNMPALRVPLLIRWPAGGVPRGVVVQTPVSLRDLPATLLQQIGDQSSPRFPGISLAPLWAGRQVTPSPIVSELFWVANQPEWYPIAAGNMHSLMRSGFHFIAGVGQKSQLYDVMNDPLERHDLSTDRNYADTVRAMAKTLDTWPLGDRHGR